MKLLTLTLTILAVGVIAVTADTTNRVDRLTGQEREGFFKVLPHSPETGESEAAHTINYTEVYSLGHAPHLRGNQHGRHKKYLGRSPVMNILTGLKCLKQGLILRIMGQHPEIDLRIITGQ